MYDKLGVVYSSLDSLDNAEQYFREAQKIASSNNAEYTAVLSAVDLADVLIKKNEFVNAMVSLNELSKSSAINKFPYLKAKAEILKGNIFEKKDDFNRAKNAYENVLNTVNTLNEKNLEVEAYYRLAKLFDSKNLNEAAESYYSSAVKIIEDVSRPLFSQEEVQISYFTGNREIYDSFAGHYLKLNKYKEAFNLINKSHSRNTIQNLNNLKLNSEINDSSLLSKLYDYDWMIHSGVYSDKRTEELKDSLRLLKSDLINKNKNLSDYLNAEQWPAIEEIQNSIEENQDIISFYSTDNNVYAFLITKNKFKPFQFNISRKQLVDLINNISPYFEKSIKNSNSFYNQDLFSFNAKSSNELYKQIVGPVIKEIPVNDEIIICPSTELLSLPFEFLVTEYDNSGSPYDYKDKKFLVSNYNISYSPSVTTYIQQKNNDLKNDGKVLLVGNPVVNTETNEFADRRGLLDESPGIPRNLAFLPLKYSGEEVNSIGEIVNANKILLDKNATETNFKHNAELSRIIHLSTHSFLYKNQPLIFFSNSQDSENDGFLEAGEIVKMKLNSDLVVLSSCNSGLGKVDESEGILGLTKAFYEAGAKSLVVSLWDVNDKYTAKLMTLFYEKLSMGYNKSRALRMAKLDFIKKYSANPYYWGAFVLSGNISPVQINHNANNSLTLVILLIIIAASVGAVILLKKKRITV